MADIENVVEKEFSIWYIKDNEKYELPKEEYGKTEHYIGR